MYLMLQLSGYVDLPLLSNTYYSVQSQYSRPLGSVSYNGTVNVGMVNTTVQYFYNFIVI